MLTELRDRPVLVFVFFGTPIGGLFIGVSLALPASGGMLAGC
jgi:hypothetical protein